MKSRTANKKFKKQSQNREGKMEILRSKDLAAKKRQNLEAEN